MKNNIEINYKKKKNIFEKKYVITWHCGVIGLPLKNINKISIGICEYSDGVAFIATFDPNKNTFDQDILKVMCIHDIYVTKNSCEEGKYCINLSCPLNKADPLNFKEYGEISKEEFLEIHNTLEKIKDEYNLSIEKIHYVVNYDKPIVMFRKNKKREIKKKL
ncbi:MAG: hypothetical protein AC479_05715 [miscellaneous Crenarchaeota group-6 archaeon AD8-1]|nr:MAG: hypothetical protein AC479_05715 [miscellaneous Crenarchaeota group-6 archaeon AD8-1]